MLSVPLLLRVLASAALAGSESLHYTIKLHPERPERAIEVSGRHESPCLEGRSFAITVGYGLAKDLRLVRDIRFAERGHALRHEQKGGKWTLPGRSCNVDFSYELDTSTAGYGIKGTDAGYDVLPQVGADYLTFGPSLMLVRPSPEPRRARVRVEVPAGWEADSGHDLAKELPDFPEFLGGLVVAHRSGSAVRARQGPIRFLALQSARDQAKALRIIDALRWVAKIQLRVFSFMAPRRGDYLVALIPGPAFDGSARERSLVMSYSADAAEEKLLDPQALPRILAHELFHVLAMQFVYLPGETISGETSGDGRWFAEGFTEYFTQYTLLRAGLISPGAYLTELSKKEDNLAFDRRSGASSLINASLAFYSKGKVSGSSYDGGALLAFKADWLFRKASAGRLSLPGFMKELIKGAPVAEDYATLKPALRSYASQVFPELARHIEGEDAIELSAYFEELGAQKNVKKTYRMGVIVQEKPGQLCLQEPSQRLQDFGLQDGDCIVSVGGAPFKDRPQIYAFADKPIPLGIRRGDQALTIPIKLEEHAVVSWDFPNGPCAAPCRGFLCGF